MKTEKIAQIIVASSAVLIVVLTLFNAKRVDEIRDSYFINPQWQDEVVRPEEVLEQVKKVHVAVEELDARVDVKTRDRFTRKEFQDFLEQNPELKRPDGF